MQRPVGGCPSAGRMIAASAEAVTKRPGRRQGSEKEPRQHALNNLTILVINAALHSVRITDLDHSGLIEDLQDWLRLVRATA